MNRTEWVKALRSGEWKQCRHYMYNTRDNSFCCLGVACRLIKPMEDYKEQESAFRVMREHYGIGRYTAFKLADMNDSQRKTFTEIADYIETLPEVTD